MPDKKKGFYSSREAAELLGVAVSTVQLWTNNGLLKAWTTAGGHRRIDRNSVEKILSEQKEVMGSEEGAESTLKVLIVEDNQQQQRLYEKQFSAWKMNMSIDTAENGYEGLIKIGRNLPDVIITDLVMPEMDGFQMVKAIKEIPELDKSLIIVITGLTLSEIDERGGLPDGVHILTKPVDFKKMEMLLNMKIEARAA